MAKIFKTTDDVAKMVHAAFDETHLDVFGVGIRVMSLTKSKDVVKISKANAATEFLTNSDGMLQVFIYEEAFDRLSDLGKLKLLEGAFSNVSYDTEKDKLLIDSSQYGEIIRMRQKYPDYLDVIETSQLVMQQIEDEEKERKAQEKEAKKNKKN